MGFFGFAYEHSSSISASNFLND